MVLLAPLVLVAPLLLLAEAVVTLVRLGPLGWPLSAALVGAALWSCRWLWRRGCRWWAGTKAPVRPAATGGTGPASAAPPGRPAGR